MVKIHKILTGLALWGIISAGAVLCPVWAGAKTEKYTNTDFAMNTVVSETLYTTGKNLNPSVGELLKNTEENLLSWTEEDSQIAALNAAQGKTLEVSDELAGYLEKIQQLSVDSEGAFDPTIGKIIRLWDIGGENAGIPAQEELDKLLKEANGMTKAVAYKQRIDLQNKEDVAAAADELKAEFFSALSTEHPDLYRQLVTALDRHTKGAANQ